MKDIGVHLLLFVVVGLAIVVLNAVYAEPDDGRALRSLPRRFLWFAGGCALLAAILIVLEHTLAAVE